MARLKGDAINNKAGQKGRKQPVLQRIAPQPRAPQVPVTRPIMTEQGMELFNMLKNKDLQPPGQPVNQSNQEMELMKRLEASSQADKLPIPRKVAQHPIRPKQTVHQLQQQRPSVIKSVQQVQKYPVNLQQKMAPAPAPTTQAASSNLTDFMLSKISRVQPKPVKKRRRSQEKQDEKVAGGEPMVSLDTEGLKRLIKKPNTVQTVGKKKIILKPVSSVPKAVRNRVKKMR